MLLRDECCTCLLPLDVGGLSAGVLFRVCVSLELNLLWGVLEVAAFLYDSLKTILGQQVLLYVGFERMVQSLFVLCPQTVMDCLSRGISSMCVRNSPRGIRITSMD